MFQCPFASLALNKCNEKEMAFEPKQKLLHSIQGMNKDLSDESLSEMVVCDVEFAECPLDKVAHWLQERDVVSNELRTQVATLKAELANLQAQQDKHEQLLRAIRHWIKDGLTWA